jgi:hypothetical protein
MLWSALWKGHGLLVSLRLLKCSGYGSENGGISADEDERVN